MNRQTRSGLHPSLIPWITLAAAGVGLVWLRTHAFALPLETDECNYAYIASRLLAGDRLYVDVWDHQPPGVFVLFAGLIAVFGKSDFVFRAAAIMTSLASMILMHRFVLCRHGPIPAAMAAVLFALTSSDPGTAGDGCNREIFMNVCTLAALAMLHRPGDKSRHALGAGLFLGLGSTLKTVVAAHWLAIAVWIVAAQWRATGNAISGLRRVMWLAAGPVAVWTAVSAYFASTGRWRVFVDAVFAYNIGYSRVDHGMFARLGGFFTPIFDVFSSATPLWYATVVAMPLLIVVAWRRIAADQGAVIAYGLGGFLAVCLPGQFWPHYYYLLIPATILICVSTAASLAERISQAPARRVLWFCGWLWVASVAAYQFRYYASLDPEAITAPHPKYRYRQAWSHGQGRRIAELTDPDDTIFVWGRDAGVYYYADRRCASRYTMVGALADDTRGGDERREVLLRELARRRPRIVIIVEPEFPRLKAFLEQNYQLASPRGVDRDDDNPDKIVMVALMDVDRPVSPIDWEWPESR